MTAERRGRRVSSGAPRWSRAGARRRVWLVLEHGPTAGGQTVPTPDPRPRTGRHPHDRPHPQTDPKGPPGRAPAEGRRAARSAARGEERVKAQQALSRTGWWLLDSDDTIVGFTRTPRRGQRRRPTTRRLKSQAQVARAHADLAERRATTQHALTKRLSTSHDVVAIEDLNVAGMTRTARGTLEQSGSNVRAKAGLNRSILDVGFGEIRRQLTYKAAWYGSRLAVIDRWEPTSKTCSTCGTARATLPLAEREYHCTTCDTRIDRDLNAARNILAAAVMLDDARGKQESRNAHGGPGADTSATSRRCEEGQDPPGTGHPDRGTGRPPPQTQPDTAAPAA
ncbi:RNA-guided endonuclease InsQ/TnpB family protein [Janibacter terrae]|uniref:RNA-guided endonuclease InsQ/TnpB family protein n=1 Tax=Janibacter terrae TaxID=103817 RepID=UPI00146B61F8|nr:RNA-guided endonuclease TnpB family protein [Janibacter terrae]